MNALTASWDITALAPSLEIICHAAPVLEDAVLLRGIEDVWQDTLRVHPKLYNGRVFCLSALSPERLSGFWCEYRWVLAQMRSPSLAEKLNLRSLAVTGLLVCPDGIVLGRRNPNSLYLPGFWQGVPAGSVEARSEENPLDLTAQLLAELDEEVGLSSAVTISPALLACEHSTTGIVDIGFAIHTKHDFAHIKTAWQSRANNEYDRLECHRRDAIDALKPTLLPTTRAMLEKLAP